MTPTPSPTPTVTPTPTPTPTPSGSSSKCEDKKNPDKQKKCECHELKKQMIAQYKDFDGIIGIAPCGPDDTEDVSASFTSDSFSTQSAIAGKILSPPGSNLRTIAEPWSYLNPNDTPKEIIIGVYSVDKSDKTLNLVKTLAQATIPAKSPLGGIVSWNGTNDLNRAVSNGSYKMKTSANEITIQHVKVNCSGYFDHYPKVLLPSRQDHIEYRHDAFFISPQLEDLMFEWVDNRKMNLSQFARKLAKTPMGTEVGKGALFPEAWGPDIYNGKVISIANLESSQDECFDDPKDQNQFIVDGDRGLQMEVVVRQDNDHIVTGYPIDGAPGSLDPVYYYTSPDVLNDVIHETR